MQPNDGFMTLYRIWVRAHDDLVESYYDAVVAQEQATMLGVDGSHFAKAIVQRKAKLDRITRWMDARLHSSSRKE